MLNAAEAFDIVEYCTDAQPDLLLKAQIETNLAYLIQRACMEKKRGTNVRYTEPPRVAIALDCLKDGGYKVNQIFQDGYTILEITW